MTPGALEVELDLLKSLRLWTGAYCWPAAECQAFSPAALAYGRSVGISVSRRIAAPAASVWELLVDWPRQGEWMPATTVRVLPGPDTGIGTRLEARTGIGRLVVVDPMEVVEWRPPYRCVTRHDGRVVRGLGVFEIEPLGAEACRFGWREEFDRLPLWLRVPYATLSPFATPFFALALRRLERLAAPRVA
jgi:hypothetical protein